MLRRVAPFLFIVSGLAGLLLQVAWFRLLSQSLGGTLAAATVVLSAFMLGLSAGSAYFGSHAQRWGHPLRAYGLLEAGAGVTALLTLVALHLLDSAYAALAGPFEDSPGVLLAIKAILATLTLAPCTFFMGGTLPVLCQALARRADTSGGDTGSLYALNIVGAVLGTLVALFVTLPLFGLSTSVLLAAGCDLAVAAVVLTLARAHRADSAQPTPESPPSPPQPVAPLTRAFAALLFVVGFAGIAFEVLWTRVLAFYFGSGAQAFGMVLAVVLAGLAIGGFLGGHLADRTGKPVLVLAVSQLLVVAAVLHQIWRLPELPDFMYSQAMALGYEKGISYRGFVMLLLIGTVQFILPASLAMGAAFPAAVRALVRDPSESGAVVGRLAAANSLGTIPGAVIAAYAFVPAFGVQGSMLAIAALNIAVAAAAVAFTDLRRRAVVLAAGAAGIAILAAWGAFGLDHARILAGSGVFADDGKGRTLLHLEEDAHGTVSLSRVVDSRGTWLSLSIDGVNVAGTSPPLLACQTLQGQLPLLLHPNPRRILHVGFGSGGTAAAVATHSSVEELHVAEINPAVLRLSEEDMPAVNRRVLHDPRVQVHLADGRNYLLGTRRRFDCILSDSIHPRYRGNASLYTVEYFRLCRSRLAEGGLVSTWLPIYSLSKGSLRSIIASMREVFPATSVWYLNSTVNEFVIVVGRTETGAFDVSRMGAAMGEPAVRANLAEVGVNSLEHLLDYYIAEGPELDGLIANVELHHDDRPWVELQSATVMNRDASWLANLRLVFDARTSVVPHLRFADDAFLERMGRFEAATTRALPGHACLLTHDRACLKNTVREAVRINPDDREPWEVFGPPPWVRGFVSSGGQKEE